MSWSRIQAVLVKDFHWALNNLKLLGVMILPVVFTLIFSRLPDGALLGFSIVFIGSFIGVFTTSYLIIEEKNRGTILALLTTPLNGWELMLSKFLFSLILTLLLILFAIVMNSEYGMLANPILLLNICLFSGLTCFMGCVLGLFCKNEQELGIISPIILFLFIMGDLIEKISKHGSYIAYFPEFHMVQFIKNPSMEFMDSLYHSGFSLGLFFVWFLMAGFYTNFYFANHNEKRFSWVLPFGFSCFIGLLVFSGTLGLKEDKVKDGEYTGKSVVKFAGERWSGKAIYDAQNFTMKNILKTRKKQVYVLRSKKFPSVEYLLITAVLTEKEKKVSKKEQAKRTVLVNRKIPWRNRSFKEYIMVRNNKLAVRYSDDCEADRLSIVFESSMKETKNIKAALDEFQQWRQKIDWACLPVGGH